MKRSIVAFHPDDDDEWVANLTCGHGQHVRHRPPFQLRPWILDDAGRRSRLGALLDCPLCDRAELPDGLGPITPKIQWDERTMPEDLRVAHRLKRCTWGQVVVRAGQVRLVVRTNPAIDVVVDPDAPRAIPPEVDFSLRPMGAVQFSLELFSIPPRSGGVLGTSH